MVPLMDAAMDTDQTATSTSSAAAANPQVLWRPLLGGVSEYLANGVGHRDGAALGRQLWVVTSRWPVFLRERGHWSQIHSV